VAQATTDEEFDRLAREVFAFQYERCAPYRAYCDRVKLTPQTVTHWKQIPAVPTSAFKDFALTCFPVEEAVAEFHTSGTTREKAGKHYLRTLELYEAAIRPNFAAHLLPDGTRLPMIILMASPREAPHSSLSHMMGIVAREFGAKNSAFYVEDGLLHVERVVRDLSDAQVAHRPVFLLGTAFAFVHLLDHLARQGLRFEMAKGSRVMETGGFKGRSREMPKAELYGLIERRIGIPKTRIVNEYGMTELSTQFYDGSLRAGRQTDAKTAPPWARVVIIDPNTGRKAAENERGLIRVYDLANLWSIMCIQTEDLGVARDADPASGANSFEVLGRVAGAEVRGCSLTAEDLRLE
jgi:phenylacetate-coenzyme A ligase PaaK-like adenylate-forming protein